MQYITTYFPNLTDLQKKQFEALDALYRDWNSKINVISRKDIDCLYLHHVLHSLAIANVANFVEGTTVLDLGTGGGFPGIPLAIFFPQTEFTLCDSVGKKIIVANEVSKALGLNNVKCINRRAEQIDDSFDYVVSRAVASLSDFLPWVKGKWRKEILYLKGGDLISEIAQASQKCKIDIDKFSLCDISEWFKEDYFAEKKIVIIRQ